MTPLFFLVVSRLVVPVLCEETPPTPPTDVYVNQGLLTWTPTTDNATYTVEYHRRKYNWEEVPGCVQMSSSSCDFSSVRNEEELGCVGVRVRAVRGGLSSREVEACSHHGESCSPDFSLSLGHRSMTVGIPGNTSFKKEYGGHGEHLVYFGKEGQLVNYEESEGSVVFRDLEEGQRYCAWVQYVYLKKVMGPPRCTQCETILVTTTKETVMITVAVVFIILVLLVPIVSYFLIYHFKRIKQMMQVPYEISNLFPETPPEQQVCILPCSEEHYDLIVSMTPVDGGQRRLSSSSSPTPPLPLRAYEWSER